MKVVINACYGGYSLGKQAAFWLQKKGVQLSDLDTSSLNDWGSFRMFDEDRANPLLVELVEVLGKEASGRCASLRVIEISDDVEWEVEEYDGFERIAEKHRSWP